jgi:hypothetical protein
MLRPEWRTPTGAKLLYATETMTVMRPVKFLPSTENNGVPVLHMDYRASLKSMDALIIYIDENGQPWFESQLMRQQV